MSSLNAVTLVGHLGRKPTSGGPSAPPAQSHAGGNDKSNAGGNGKANRR